MTNNIGLALRALRRNRLRTILSVLGTAVGIASIVVIMSAGESLKASLKEQFDQFGTDYIEVEIKVPNTSQTSSANATGLATGISITTLSHTDKSDIDALDNISASYGAVIGQASVSSTFNEKRYSYWAVSHEFPQIDQAKLELGRFYTKDEEESHARVAVIGHDVWEALFPNQDPIGQSFKMQNTKFRVIGVYEARGSVSFLNLDENVYVPLKTAQTYLLGFDHLMAIFAKMVDVTRDQETVDQITQIVRENHEITDPNKDDFAVITSAEAQAILDTIFNGITLVLILIASVALLVGGVGIMNIMYVAISERVFEIGLRKAVGATDRTIRQQFLTEAIIITLLGGIFGVIFATLLLVVMYFLAPYIGFSWPFAISRSSIVLGVIFSSAVGLFFGYFPAKKAAELRPVQALTQNSS